MKVDLFDFDLPESAIALRPARPRDAARLLVVGPEGPFGHRHVRDLPALLRPGDALVTNVTRVVPARLRGVRVRAGREARIEVLLHRRLSPDRWLAFARPAKRLAVGDGIRFAAEADAVLSLEACVEDRRASGEICLRFGVSGAALDAAVASVGEVPLPPYIARARPADHADASDYQTVFARSPGAVAAPTAGLHATEDLLARLVEAGISRHEVTLHVGAGTFLPVKADDTDDHRMHPEWGEVDEGTAASLNAVRSRGGRVVALGTTSLRLLESAASPDGRIRAFSGETDIFITPGYRFRAVDLLVTNFHLPRSTLFMLVSAFAGLARMRAAYAEAIASGYRFYSYGDGSLLERSREA